ncbi:MAG TPA: NPCBM/NEW2 domain-containing protein [Anaerohalosphaeraceae bacterium]|nr:NPCBM/NEW2 domain-containing protein [Anaerohalosphaeraceae bacterium]HOM77013.1 NPCBM/NEW2 domain-containing protein [Anaerohalosphaeraceae bacterium]HPC65019.1 NPCBM/NEW2 domain-containing protein [Anaerohalosphaeraceae bacterium]HPO70966.1 NPCBM/NEW2 domain-containing protein [Anaerohalosphaeraceae bacterium]HRV21317.1 NPCBM/NEW2 domain-containing protein [Anaerohalosphaeraceae bacterium]
MNEQWYSSSMNDGKTNPVKIYHLLLRLVEGDINDAGLAELKAWFQQEQAIPIYWEFIKNYTAVKLYEETSAESFGQMDLLDNSMDMDLWLALADDEKNAPEVHLPACPQKPVRQWEKPAAVPKVTAGSSKLSMFSLIASLAAILFLVVYAYFVPKASRGFEVATLADSINAKWADDASMKPGTRLVTGQAKSLLRGGLAKLVFDNNAVVTIEGPAEFEIISEDRIKLQYGRLYSIVPQEALGFSVTTPNAMVIDLGTQFGVQVDFQGTTELHVSQGKTQLIAGENKNKVKFEIFEGSARKISGISSDITDIPCNNFIFVRQINSQTNLIWRGQPSISLADITGGGNGLGTGRLGVGIHPLTGEIGDIVAEDRMGEGKYITVPQNRYIDGVFVPNGQFSPVVVSSKGHIFTECPVTNNIFYMEIINSKLTDPAVPMLWKEAAPGSGIYGSNTCPSIFMHANLGITYNLDAIRSDFNGAEITRFTAEAGLSPSATRKGNVDVWVLVDGNVRYCQKNITEKGKSYPIEIDIKKTDRFLTLITTDGGDIDYPEPARRATDSDWALFANPELVLTTGQVH